MGPQGGLTTAVLKDEAAEPTPFILVDFFKLLLIIHLIQLKILYSLV
jgi:hypothetical protein